MGGGSNNKLLIVDYMSKRVVVITTRTNDGQGVINLVRPHTFCIFGVSRAIVSD